MNRTDDVLPPSATDLDARLMRLRERAVAIEPPAVLETELRARLFGPTQTTAARARRPAPATKTSPRARFAARWSAWLAWPRSRRPRGS